MTKTLYYYIYHDGEFSRPYADMHSLQADIASMGAPHHVLEVMTVTFKEQAGQIASIERTAAHPVWWRHWRDLENAKRITARGNKEGL